MASDTSGMGTSLAIIYDIHFNFSFRSRNCGFWESRKQRQTLLYVTSQKNIRNESDFVHLLDRGRAKDFVELHDQVQVRNTVSFASPPHQHQQSADEREPTGLPRIIPFDFPEGPFRSFWSDIRVARP